MLIIIFKEVYVEEYLLKFRELVNYIGFEGKMFNVKKKSCKWVGFRGIWVLEIKEFFGVI